MKLWAVINWNVCLRILGFMCEFKIVIKEAVFYVSF